MALLSLLGHSYSFAMYNQCPVNGGGQIGRVGFGLGSLSTTSVMGALLSGSMSGGNTGVSALISNISVAPSSGWYFSLTPFESILLGLIILKLMLLRYLTILPVSINNISDGNFFDFGKRKKRETENPKLTKEKERLAETMFTVIRRLDMQDCLLRTLCELQVHSNRGYKLPRETKLTLSALSKSGWKRKQEKKPELSPDFIEDRPILSVFEEAVEIGWEAKSHNGTDCQERYFICPLTSPEIIQHFETVETLNVL